ncbi:MAG: ATP-binding cassette domain-containing protein [Dysgonamonadaceae bacterium]|jgi:zinc transport system ATP-binding protein|nr:ATP-binding cassette domain-containing protein [Dysgonamonadaceae bacterium]
MSNVLVDIQDICAGYDGNILLRDVSLKIYERDFLGIAGPNGGGKTTLVKCILGLLKPVSGCIVFPDREVKNRTGYMPQINQTDRKFPILAREVIESGLMAAKNKSKSEKKEKVRVIIKEMDIENIAEKAIGKLSGGQLQRVLLARAIVNDPKLLILDEPSSYVDKPFETHFYQLLRTINNKDTAIVLVSHDMETIRSYAKNMVWVEETLDYKTLIV